MQNGVEFADLDDEIFDPQPQQRGAHVREMATSEERLHNSPKFVRSNLETLHDSMARKSRGAALLAAPATRAAMVS